MPLHSIVSVLTERRLWRPLPLRVRRRPATAGVASEGSHSSSSLSPESSSSADSSSIMPSLLPLSKVCAAKRELLRTRHLPFSRKAAAFCQDLSADV